MLVKISKPDWQTDEHTDSVRKMFELMEGAEIVKETDSNFEVECTDEVKDILDDMDRCDYLMFE